MFPELIADECRDISDENAGAQFNHPAGYFAAKRDRDFSIKNTTISECLPSVFPTQGVFILRFGRVAPVYSARDRFVTGVPEAAGCGVIKVKSDFGVAATAASFRRHSDNVDIIHLSMHAQVDGEKTLESFLAFRVTGAHDGRVTVNDLLGLSFKNGSLVFLASCNTKNVLNG